MKIRELIEQLQSIERNHGDLFVYVYDMEFSEYWSNVEVKVESENNDGSFRIDGDYKSAKFVSIGMPQ